MSCKDNVIKKKKAVSQFTKKNWFSCQLGHKTPELKALKLTYFKDEAQFALHSYYVLCYLKIVAHRNHPKGPTADTKGGISSLASGG